MKIPKIPRKSHEQGYLLKTPIDIPTKNHRATDSFRRPFFISNFALSKGLNDTKQKFSINNFKAI